MLTMFSLERGNNCLCYIFVKLAYVVRHMYQIDTYIDVLKETSRLQNALEKGELPESGRKEENEKNRRKYSQQSILSQS